MAMLLPFESTEAVPYVDELTLENMQNVVGGYIEYVYLKNSLGELIGVLVVDEEGLLKNKKVNPIATSLARGGRAIDPEKGVIVGDALFLLPEEANKDLD